MDPFNRLHEYCERYALGFQVKRKFKRAGTNAGRFEYFVSIFGGDVEVLTKALNLEEAIDDAIFRESFRSARTAKKTA